MIEILGRPIKRPRKGQIRIYFIYKGQKYRAKLFSELSEREGDCIFVSSWDEVSILRYDAPYCVNWKDPVSSLNRMFGAVDFDAAIQRYVEIRQKWDDQARNLGLLEESNE